MPTVDRVVAAPEFYPKVPAALELDDENVVNPNLQCCGRPLGQCQCPDSGKRSKPQPEEQHAA